MQNLINESPVKRSYPFVDTIRCIAMIFIVMEHSTYFDPAIYSPHGGIREFAYLLSIQFSKFGTICFFLLAGFLIGDKFTDYTPLQYLKRRVKGTVWPWLFWSACFTIFTNLDSITNIILSRPDPNGTNPLHTIWDATATTYLYTNYWFIPNFLFCISLLLIFKKYMYNYVFGAILLLFSIFYSINIYFAWVPSSHTIAIFGFVFFLWLGAQLNKNWIRFNNWLNKTSAILWVILSAVTLLLSIGEMKLLQSLHIADAFNSLRFSNILYSLFCFLGLLKINNFKYVDYLKPRETTYGIYLIHYFILATVLPLIFNGSIRTSVALLSLPVILCYQLIKFLVVYSLTLVIVLRLNKTNLKWMIGRGFAIKRF